ACVILEIFPGNVNANHVIFLLYSPEDLHMEGAMSLRLGVAAFVCGFVVTLVPAHAQTYNGRISGTVTDSTGAPIASVSVTVQDDATKVTYRSVTDADGLYQVPQLPVGQYNVSAEAPGFKKIQKSGYDLVDAGRLTVDFKLELGAITETVTVTAAVGET